MMASVDLLDQSARRDRQDRPATRARKVRRGLLSFSRATTEIRPISVPRVLPDRKARRARAERLEPAARPVRRSFSSAMMVSKAMLARQVFRGHRARKERPVLRARPAPLVRLVLPYS